MCQGTGCPSPNMYLLHTCPSHAQVQRPPSNQLHVVPRITTLARGQGSTSEARAQNCTGVFSVMPFGFLQGVRWSIVVSVLDCQSRGSGFKPRPGQTFYSRLMLQLGYDEYTDGIP